MECIKAKKSDHEKYDYTVKRFGYRLCERKIYERSDRKGWWNILLPKNNLLILWNAKWAAMKKKKTCNYVQILSDLKILWKLQQFLDIISTLSKQPIHAWICLLGFKIK